MNPFCLQVLHEFWSTLGNGKYVLIAAFCRVIWFSSRRNTEGLFPPLCLVHGMLIVYRTSLISIKSGRRHKYRSESFNATVKLDCKRASSVFDDSSSCQLTSPTMQIYTIWCLMGSSHHLPLLSWHKTIITSQLQSTKLPVLLEILHKTAATYCPCGWILLKAARCKKRSEALSDFVWEGSPTWCHMQCGDSLCPRVILSRSQLIFCHGVCQDLWNRDG